MGNKKLRKWLVYIMIIAMLLSGIGMSLSMLAS